MSLVRLVNQIAIDFFPPSFIFIPIKSTKRTNPILQNIFLDVDRQLKVHFKTDRQLNSHFKAEQQLKAYRKTDQQLQPSLVAMGSRAENPYCIIIMYLEGLFSMSLLEKCLTNASKR